MGDDKDSKKYVVWRQDDNGNRAVVKDGLTLDEAEKLAKEFEERGHKQMYWVRAAAM